MLSAEELGLTFEEPTPKELGYSIWRERIAFLKEFPGQWGRFDASNPGSAHKYAKEAGGQWEFCRRTIDGTVFVFAKYKGDAND